MQEAGGLTIETTEGVKKKTPGGIFMTQLKQRISPDVFKKIQKAEKLQSKNKKDMMTGIGNMKLGGGEQSEPSKKKKGKETAEMSCQTEICGDMIPVAGGYLFSASNSDQNGLEVEEMKISHREQKRIQPNQNPELTNIEIHKNQIEMND
jgi:hypothetical protein